MTVSILFARQPVFDQQMNTYAYHLLYRDSKGQGPGLSFDGVAATTEVLVSAFSNMLDKGQLKYLPAMINFNADWLYDGQLPSVPPETLILDVEQPETVTDSVITQLVSLNEQGYRICVSPDADVRLLACASIIKVDIQTLPAEKLAAICKKYSTEEKLLLAEKVETYEQFSLCKRTGFDLFLGYFFARPQQITGRKLSRNELVMLQLIGEVHKPDASPASIEVLIQQDPRLTAGLLRLVNSAVFRGQRTIASIAEAVIVLGMDELKKWIVLLSLTENSDKPMALVQTLLLRGKMCELSAQVNDHVHPGTAFMTGLLSGVDSLLDLPLEEMLEQLPVQIEVKRALQGGMNPLGKMLNHALSYTRGDWEQLSEAELEHLKECYEKASTWADEILTLLD